MVVVWTAYGFISHHFFYHDIHFLFLLSMAGILNLNIVCLFYYLVVECTLRTACNFEGDLQYWGELSDLVKM